MDSESVNGDFNNKTFPFWQAPCLAFFSNPFYRDLAQRWKGLALTYVLVLPAVNWLPNTFILNNRLVDFRTNYLPELLAQVPRLEIQNCEVRADVKMPYQIVDPKSNATLVVIDKKCH